jgi:hypothetical protein
MINLHELIITLIVVLWKPFKMIRIVATLICVLMLSGIYGQIIVTNSNFVQVGDSITAYQTTNLVPNQGGSGPNQIWDFSNDVAPFSGVTPYIDPSNTPFASQFPQANLASVVQGTYNYEENAGQNWLFHGIRGTSFTPGDYYFEYTPAHYNAKFPINYQDSYSHSYVKHYFLLGNTSSYDSLVADYQAQITSTVDGWGILKTPISNYQALREFRQETDVITQNMFKNGAVINNTTYTIFVDGYYWWSEDVDIKYPIAIHNTSGTSTSSSSSWNYYDIEPVAPTLVDGFSSELFNIFPNPSNGMMNIQTPWGSFLLEVLDFQGKRVFVSNFKNGSFDIELSDGFYFFKLTNADEVRVEKVVIVN